MKYLRSDLLKTIVDWFVENVEHVLIRATPILAPLPSAFAITYALARAGWMYPALMGGIIEALGMGAGAFMGNVAAYNQRHPQHPLPPAWGRYLFGFYVLLAAFIIGGYETLPAISAWLEGAATTGEVIKSIVPLLFPGLTLIGAVIVALSRYMSRMDDEVKHIQERTEAGQDAQQRRQDDDHNLDMEIKRMEAEQRLALRRAEAEQRLAIERQKAEAKLSTKLSTVNRQPVDSSVNQDLEPEQTTTSEQPVDTDDTIAKLLELYKRNPKTSLRKAGNVVGMSHTGVDKALDRMVVSGLISRNGVVEVLGVQP